MGPLDPDVDGGFRPGTLWLLGRYGRSVDGDGRINAAGAVKIMRMAAGLPELPDSAQLRDLSALQAGLVSISVLTDITVSQGGSVWVPANINDATNLASVDLIISFDYSVISVANVHSTALTANCDVAPNIPEPGQIRISLKPKAGYEDGLEGGSGPLVEFEFVDSARAQGDVTTLVKLAAVRLGDRYGRGFSNSVLEMSVGMLDGQPMVDDGTPPQVIVFTPGDGSLDVWLAETLHIGLAKLCHRKA